MLFLHYSVRSLRARVRANLVTMVAVALFVVGGSLGLAMYLSLKAQLVDSVPPENIIVLAQGTPSEAGSRLSLEAARKAALMQGIRAEGDAPLAVRETLATVQIAPGQSATLRGIDDRSLQVHRAVVISGVAPKPGTLEILVGRQLAARQPRVRVGSELALTGGKALVTGMFSANGSVLEDEIWTPRAAVELHTKQKTLSSTTLVASSAAAVPGLVQQLNESKDLNVQAASVAEFRASKAGLETILKVVLVLLIVLSVVATSAIATTMSATVVARMPEFASLIAIGFRRNKLGRLVVIESALLGLTGAAFGVVIAEAIRRALGTIMLGANPIEIAASPAVLGFGLGLGLLTGVIGALAPSLSVRRLDVVSGLR